MGLKIHEYPLEALDVQDEDFYDVDYWNGTGWDSHKISGATLKAQLGQDVQAHKNFGASTYQTSLASTIVVNAGSSLNLTSVITNSSKVAAESTSYYDLEYRYSRSIILSGTSGSADIVIDGITYPINFVTSLSATATAFVSSIATAMSALNIKAYGVGIGADGRIRFCCDSNTVINGITITNTSGSLNGSIKNEFTGLALAQLDHFKVPYPLTPIDGQLLNHKIRVNLFFITGAQHYGNVGLYNISNDGTIEYQQQVNRNPHTGFNLVLLDIFTASSSDEKVKDGFYIRFSNTSNANISVARLLKISVVTNFQNPTFFP